MIQIQKYSIPILILFHTIGLGLFLSSRDFASLSYINLIICATILYLTQTKRFLLPLVVIGIGGYVIELIGVHTGLLFGNYDYGSSLGLKIFDVPIIIGLNWYCVVLSSVSLSNLFKLSRWKKAIVAAGLCTILDFLIEPVAIKFEFWSWDNLAIPPYNYICWFIFSYLFSLFYIGYSNKPNKTASALYVIWILFFVLLICF